MRIETTLKELESVIEDLRDKELLNDFDEIKVMEEDNNLMLVDGYVVKIPSLGLEMRSGTMLLKDEDEDEYYPDWDLSAIYILDSDPKEYLYYEQDGFAVSLHNYLTSSGDPDISDDTECIIYGEEDVTC